MSAPVVHDRYDAGVEVVIVAERLGYTSTTCSSEYINNWATNSNSVLRSADHSLAVRKWSIDRKRFPSRTITGVIIVLVTAAMEFTNMESITRVPTSKTPEQARPLVLSASRPRWWLVNFVISSVDGLTIGPSRQSPLERVSYLSRKG